MRLRDKIRDWSYNIIFFKKSHNIIILQDCGEKTNYWFCKIFTKNMLVSLEIESKNLQNSFYQNLLNPNLFLKWLKIVGIMKKVPRVVLHLYIYRKFLNLYIPPHLNVKLRYCIFFLILKKSKFNSNVQKQKLVIGKIKKNILVS